MPQTFVVVPCFNEAQRLDLPRFREFARQTDDVTLLLVNDGSKDGTLRLMRELQQDDPERFRLLDLPLNVGQSEAVRQGVREALRFRPDYVAYWDADLATPLEAVWQFQDVLERRPELLMVIGSRVAMSGRCIRRCRVRHILDRMLAVAASRMLRIPIYDTQCGAKMFRVTPQLDDVFHDVFRSRWLFDVEILARMLLLTQPADGDFDAERAIYELPLDQWQDLAGLKHGPGELSKAVLDLAVICRALMFGKRRPSAKYEPAVLSVVSTRDAATEPPADNANSYRKAA